MESELREDRRLGRRVKATDIGRRVSFGVAETLRLCEHVGVVRTLLIHLAEDEVGRAVDDAEDLHHAIAGE